MRAIHPVTPPKKIRLVCIISHTSDGKSGVVSADVIVVIVILLALIALGELVTGTVALFGIQKS